MSKKITVIILSLLILNIGLTLWSLYNQRVDHARTCITMSLIYDGFMTKLDGTVYDKSTAGMANECLGNSFFLVPGF